VRRRYEAELLRDKPAPVTSHLQSAFASANDINIHTSTVAAYTDTRADSCCSTTILTAHSTTDVRTFSECSFFM
jgi:hypothetical protein